MFNLQYFTSNPPEQGFFIYNHGIKTNISSIVQKTPAHICLIVTPFMQKKYQYALKQKNVYVFQPKNIFSLRKLFYIVQKYKKIIVFGEGNAYFFQAIGYIGQRKKISLFLLETEKNRWKIKEELLLSNKEEITSKIQNFLFLNRYKENVNLFNELHYASKFYGKRTVILKDEFQSLSYQELLLKVYMLSQYFKKNIKEEKMAFFLPNVIGHALCLFSSFYLNKIPVILNFSAGSQIVHKACEATEIKTILTSRAFIIKGGFSDTIGMLSTQYRILYLEDIQQKITWFQKAKGFIEYGIRKKTETKQNTIILFTSGSESSPKGVVLSHANIYANILQAKSMIDFNETDKMFNAMPLFHSLGFTIGTILPILCGVSTFLYPTPLHFKEIPKWIEQEKSTILFGTSSFFFRYGQAAESQQLETLRYVVAGAEKLNSTVYQQWMKKFKIQILEGYGATECSPVLSVGTPIQYKPGTVGRFVPGLEYQIMPVDGLSIGGRLLVKGPNVMQGYIRYGKGFVPVGKWYDTGDVVHIDSEGFVQIVGRVKRFSKIAGEMISLNLVEDIFVQIYKSHEFAALSIPDERRGEMIVLYTTLSDVCLDDVKHHVLKIGLSLLYVPKEIRKIKDFPLSGSGKVSYTALAKTEFE